MLSVSSTGEVVCVGGCVNSREQSNPRVLAALEADGEPHRLC